MKRLLLVSVLGASFAAHATDLDISLYYSNDYASTDDVLVSSEIIGFYRSLDAANTLFTNSGVNTTFVPAKIVGLGGGVFDGNLDVWDTRLSMESGTLQSPTDSAGHIQIGVARTPYGGTIGLAEAILQSRYDALAVSGTDYKKVSIAAGIMNAFDGSFPRYPYILAHEAVHSLGGSHDSADANLFDDTSSGNNYGYGQTCDDSSLSLMDANIATDSDGYALKLSGMAGCNSFGGDMVTFLNTYVPLAEGHAASLNMNTLTLAAVEDTVDQEFEFTVTRTVNVSSSGTAYVHISGTGATATNEIAPVEVTFAANQAAATVAVPFTSIHPMFDDADPYDDKVYAAAVSDDEVVNTATDLSSINTAWTSSSSSSTSSSGGGGGSGGSASIFGLLILAAIGVRRRFLS